jgi:WD40 repeat protein
MSSPRRLSIWLLVILPFGWGCSRQPVSPDVPGLEERSETQEEAAPLRNPAIRLGSTKFRHAVVGKALTFSPDSKTLYSGGTDGTVKAWNVETGEARRTFSGHAGAVNCLALAPGGRAVATGGKDGTVRLWDSATGEQKWKAAAHKGGVRSVDFSPDGKTVASAGWLDPVARLWDVATGKEVRGITTDEDFRLTAFFSPDGQSLATIGYRDSRIFLHKAADGSSVRHIGLFADVACFSPDGRLLLAGGANEGEALVLWEVETGQKCPQSPKHHGIVHAVAFAPDGKRFAAGESFGLASVWDTTTGKKVVTLEGHYAATNAIAYSPDGKLLATGGQDGVVRLFDATAGRQLRAPDGHQAIVSALAITPDGKTLVSGGCDRSVRMWELPGGKPGRTLTWEHGKEWWFTRADVASVSVARDGKRLASSDTDGPVLIWDLVSGKQIRTIDQSPLHSRVAWDRGGDTLFLAGMDGVIGFWDVSTGKPLRTFGRAGGGIGDRALSPDGETFVCPGTVHPRTVELRSSQTGAVQSELVIPADNPAKHVTGDGVCLSFSPDGKTLAVARENMDGEARHPLCLFDVATGNVVRAFGHRVRITALAYSPDGNMIAAACADGDIGLWDCSTGERKDWFRTGQWCVPSLVFSADGTMLYSGGADGSICGWTTRPNMN